MSADGRRVLRACAVLCVLKCACCRQVVLCYCKDALAQKPGALLPSLWKLRPAKTRPCALSLWCDAHPR
eukprot:14991619-Alexandrium_andersonii.AAC.1